VPEKFRKSTTTKNYIELSLAYKEEDPESYSSNLTTPPFDTNNLEYKSFSYDVGSGVIGDILQKIL